MSRKDRIRAQRAAEQLEEPVEEAANLAKRLGLEPYPVNYWIVDYAEMNELIAYGGFQQRYPTGAGDAVRPPAKQGQFLGGKAFEIVNNDNPAHAFLQESNELADQKAVITHVEAHADFFSNNEWFGMFADNPDASAMLARHGDTIREYMQDPEIDRADVEKWIDHVLCLEDNIDQHRPYAPVGDPDVTDIDEDFEDVADQLTDLNVSDEVKQQVFSQEWLDAQTAEDESITFPAEPEKDLLAFLRTHGMQYDEDGEKAVEMEPWQVDVLGILRREAYYFAPQKMTKVMNEGWAAYWGVDDDGRGEGSPATTSSSSTPTTSPRCSGRPDSTPTSSARSCGSTSRTASIAGRSPSASSASRGSPGGTSRTSSTSGRSRTISPEPWLRDIPGSLDQIPADDSRVDAEMLEAAKSGDFDVERYPGRSSPTRV